jgi:hypothetical protein
MASGCAPGLIWMRRCASPQLHDPGWPWVPALFVASVVAMSALTVVLKPDESALGLGRFVARLAGMVSCT